MNNILMLFIFVPILTAALLALNLILAPSNPDEAKISAYECGYTTDARIVQVAIPSSLPGIRTLTTIESPRYQHTIRTLPSPPPVMARGRPYIGACRPQIRY